MLKRTLILLMSVFALNAYAENGKPEAGDIALFITDPFSSNTVGGLNLSTTSYNVGGFVIDDLMVYGGLRVLRASGDNTIGLNAGSRFYIDFQDSPIRTFIDGNLSVMNAEVDDSGVDTELRLITLGAFAGAEYMFTPNISLAARVGITVTDADTETTTGGNTMDSSTTVTNFGTTDLVLNYYF